MSVRRTRPAMPRKDERPGRRCCSVRQELPMCISDLRDARDVERCNRAGRLSGGRPLAGGGVRRVAHRWAGPADPCVRHRSPIESVGSHGRGQRSGLRIAATRCHKTPSRPIRGSVWTMPGNGRRNRGGFDCRRRPAQVERSGRRDHGTKRNGAVVVTTTAPFSFYRIETNRSYGRQ
jgi:hypothetical protein